MPEVKAGKKTSEFWVTIGSMLMGLLAAFGVVPTDTVTEILGIIAAILAGAGYSVSRGLAKKQP